MPSNKAPTQDREIAALLLRALEEQNTAWVHRALEASPTAQAARALAHFGAWHRGLFLAIIGPSNGLRVFRELPVRAQAAILWEMIPQDAARLLASADFGERVYFLSFVDQTSAEHLTRHLSSKSNSQLLGNQGVTP